MFWMYLLVCILWGLYAIEEQIKQHGRMYVRTIAVFLVNVVICPVCILIAYRKAHKLNKRKYKKL